MTLNPNDLQALWLTLELASLTTVALLFIAIPLAWLFTLAKSRWWTVLEVLFSLPLILPPTVLGFYLLVMFSPNHGLGAWWIDLTGHPFAFSFNGILVASIIYSLPFVLQPLRAGFTQSGRTYMNLAATLGASPWKSFLAVLIPLNKRVILSAATLGFAHTLGEFGVVLMVGGSIPGETRLLSIALFEHVEAGEMLQAHQLAATLLILAFLLLLLVNLFQPSAKREPANA